MRDFSELFFALDSTTRTGEKVAALEKFFRTASARDAGWALYFLSSRRVPRPVSSTELRAWVAEVSGVPLWLLEESYHSVGDLAETLSLLLPPAKEVKDLPLADIVESYVLGLGELSLEDKKSRILQLWSILPQDELFLWFKFLTGGFRVGVAHGLLVRALANVAGVEPGEMAHRLTGDWEPTEEFMLLLFSGAREGYAANRPYPFALAHPLDSELSALGEPREWQAEWKWDGIRAQLLIRSGDITLWSRGEELITNAFPELVAGARTLPPGSVLDGEVLAWRDDNPLSFGELQKRINRKKVDRKLQERVPVLFMAYDLLECSGEDIRTEPLDIRREKLSALLAAAPDCFRLSPSLNCSSWEELSALRARSREMCAEGLMLKRKSSHYSVGRKRGDWWKWKVDPFNIDAVLLYAQAGHGRRANLYTDYTFAVWSGEELVPVAKAYSGLSDKEIVEVDSFIRKHTVERFGPVRVVEPKLVFELAFEGVQSSSRHKSGVAVRFPRILRWRREKDAREADSLDTLRALVPR